MAHLKLMFHLIFHLKKIKTNQDNLYIMGFDTAALGFYA